jgi:vitamin B12/bleomycin/antimicrobial peptide transport system ATP-binding/permease protein
VRQARSTLAVFAVSTIAAVLARFAEERLGLLWREFMTKRAVATYELAKPGSADRRGRAFTANALSFALMAMNSAFTILALSGVLWSISPLLFIISGICGALGSNLTIRLGRPPTRLNSDQLDHEAGFRSALIHARERIYFYALQK